ncbi:MAG: AraC family transcriptional regulator [Phycisphaerae bacterium]|nr:AraC family transcriptional regulator [Phycisphaerae bacterium]
MDGSEIELVRHVAGLRVTRASHYTCRAPLFGPSHLHPDEFHLSYVVLGKGTIAIEGRAYDVGPKDAVVIPPRRRHRSIGDSRTDYELIEIRFAVSRPQLEAAVPALPDVVHVHNSPEFEAALDRVVVAYLRNVDRENALAKVRLAEALILLARETAPWTGTDSMTGAMERKIRQATEYIAVKHAGPLTVEELAELVGLSASHFAASFRRMTGISPIEMVIRTRLHHARELLRSSAMSISQVATVCGFGTGQYFARVFQRREGLSPNEYRRRNRGYVRQ